MIRDYKFEDIQKYLKKDADIGCDVLDAFESLSDAAIIFSPLILGPQFLPLIELLDVKDRLFNLGRKVYDYIAQKIEIDYIDRVEQIRAAYALICYTAYFDALQDALPKDVRKKLKLKFEKKKELIEKSTDTLNIVPTIADIHCNVFHADHITSFSDIKKQLINVYEHVTHGLIKMIRESSIFDEEKEKGKQAVEQLKATLEDIPEKALGIYEAQYLKLADQFNDFALFAQLQNFEGVQLAIEKNKNALDLLVNITDKIDVGLNNLNNIINSIAINYNIIQAQSIIDDLKRKYVAIIEEPIINDREIKPDNETIRIRFPKIVDAFIPQSYKCLSYHQKETKLEDATVWDNLPVQHDLDRFFIEYLYSTDGIDYPLIILGQPGSGKSLLTKVLSAQLMSNSYTVIRIPLREVNAEDGIDVLVEDEIKKLTNRPLSTQGYGGFAEQFKEKPLIIILDGYDELLQAKGDVFSGYLENVRRFQQDQKSMNRPVRIIITSRITLIDKARIPINSTILRLMEFNSQQRQAWIDIWNNINSEYFSESNIKPFNLPLKGDRNSIIELAEQPLLLLMLALYDSEANELARTSDIKRTELYDNLLRRFVRRERRRYVPGFDDKSVNEQEKIIDQEMRRLGVVAIGMYNREEVVILSRQLEEDLDAFSAHRDDGSQKNNKLKESESVLGGFFFIHKSTAKDFDAHSDNSESAYEFLHNTFGEFLAADFILRKTINEVKNIFVDRKFKSADLGNKLSNPDYLDSGWFYCLMFVPLYSRPVIIEMLREHAMKALQRALQIDSFSMNITEEDFADNLKFLVKNQLKMILNTRSCPSVMRNGIIFNRDIPLMGYLSTYSLNLIILACTLSIDGFEFNEDEYRQSEAGALDSKPWDELTSLWKAWFSPADLMGLSVILKAKRKSNTIAVRCNEKFEAMRYEQPIDILLCISSTLADNLLTGLSGLQSQRFSEITQMNHDDICEMLGNENPNIYFSYLIALLRNKINEFMDGRNEQKEFAINYKEINNIIENIIIDDRIYSIDCNVILNLCEVLECCLRRNIVFLSVRLNLIKALPRLIDDPKVVLKKGYKSPKMVSCARLMQLLVKNQGFLILDRYDESFPQYTISRGKWAEEINRSMYYLSRYAKNDRLFFHNFDESDIYQLSLKHIFEEYPMMRIDDKKRVVRQLFVPDSIEILLETNPEMLSRTILVLLEKKYIKQTISQEIINMFLDGCLRRVKSFGVFCFGFNTIINVVSIARYVKAKIFLREIGDLLKYQLFDRNPDYFASILYLYPSFISNLIDVIPEIFIDVNKNIPHQFFFDKKRRYMDPKKVIDYICVFRKFYQLFNKKSEFKKIQLKKFSVFTDMIDEFINMKEIELSKLSLSQLNDLLWYDKFMRDGLIASEIRKILDKLNLQ